MATGQNKNFINLDNIKNTNITTKIGRGVRNHRRKYKC